MKRSLFDLAPRELDGMVRLARGEKFQVSKDRPYQFLVEPERTEAGSIENVATLFLVNRECPLRCTMCDLWKHTLDETVEVGDVPGQIRFALDRLEPAPHIKLYNSGNFFDPRAIPYEDHREIADLVGQHRTVIVENHPLFCNESCGEFHDRLAGQLEVAIGLETVHEPTLQFLNKRMTLDDFRRSADQLLGMGIRLRAFILLRPPGMEQQEAIDWCLRTIESAFDWGVGVCAVIPTRGGNGMMERLQADGLFAPPSLDALEQVLDLGVGLNRGRVFVDLWDVEALASCGYCNEARRDRMHHINLNQTTCPRIVCDRCLPVPSE